MQNTNTHWVYLTVVFILSFAWQGIIFFNGGIDSPLFPVLMLFPAIVAVAFRIINKEGFRNTGWGIRKWWYFIPSIAVPLLLVIMIGWLFTALSWASLSDKHFLFQEGMIEIRKIPLILGNHSQGIMFFAVNLFLSLFLQSLLGSVVTLGEEFGWRAYVQEKLIRKFGLNRGLVLLGVIWGYWHLPIGLMGWNFPEHPLLGAFILTPVSTIFIGICLGWLYLRSESIWMPALAHAAFNLSATLLFSELIMHRNDLYLQLVFIASLGVFASLCLFSLNRKKPRLWQTSMV